MHRSRVLPLTALVAAVLAIGACGTIGDDGYSANPAPVDGAADPYAAADPNATPTPSGGSGAASGTAGPPAPAPAGEEDPLLVARDVPELGTVVADAGGFTLYRFDQDTAQPPATTCVDACATKWPPVVVNPTGQLTLDGVDQSTVGLVLRPDGTSQLTLGGWPMYRFAGDTTPGSTVGQGVGGTWFAITPQGNKAARTP